MHRTETIELTGYSPGTVRHLAVHRLGTPGARQRVYIQAGIHADELPANLVASRLLRELIAADEAGRIGGEIVVVPLANPVGAANVQAQRLMGRNFGASGQNFNRGFNDVSQAVVARLETGEDIEHAIRASLDEIVPRDEATALQLKLQKLACGADIVLDLHTDSEAELHLYLDPDHWPAAADLAGLLGAPVVMFARGSGDNPFEETCAAPYIAARAAGHDIALPFTTVVELRGERDTRAEYAERDALALFDFLTVRGVIAGDAPDVPAFDGIAADFSATDILRSPASGIVMFRQPLGAMVSPGDVIAEIVDPLCGHDQPPATVTTRAAGRFFAHTSERIAWPGSVIGKVHGTEPIADGMSGMLYD